CAALAGYVVALALEGAYHWVFERWAIGLLCVGIAVQVYRLVSRRPPAGATATRRALLGLAGVTVLANLAGVAVARGPARSLGSLANVEAGLGGLLSTPLARGTAPAAAATSRAGTPPNVLLIVLDTVRADHFSSYGYA